MTLLKDAFLEDLENRFGSVSKLPNSQSLFQLKGSRIRIYVRYSKLHGKGKTFYGLREADLKQLEGQPSVICFLREKQKEPLFVPFSNFEEVFAAQEPASDGQFKCQVLFDDQITELYIARAGRYNVEGNLGWGTLSEITAREQFSGIPNLSHSQVQTLLGAIGSIKQFDIWIPPNDRGSLDWSIINAKFDVRESLPQGFEVVSNILREIDVVWINRGSSNLNSLFEIEHSTPIYSGLLRFNDIHLTSPSKTRRYSIVSNDARQGLFASNVNRPTFKTSGITDLCSFLEYANVLSWYRRLANGAL